MDVVVALLWMTMRIADMPAPPRIAETIIVLDGGPSLEAPEAVTSLGRDALHATPAATLDDVLRSVPGFSLFRRSSSRVANPTTQGATLRGLAASGSSRALVLADHVPLNDPVGGWVYWNRVPFASLEGVDVARGAAGDLHGADAVGGTIVITSSSFALARVFAETGALDTRKLSAYVGREWGKGSIFASAEGFSTDGFVIVAPESRGSIDTPAGSRYASAHAGFKTAGVFPLTLRGGYFRESKRNGTPFQRNSTAVTHGSAVATSADWRVRAYGQVQQYDQTFSAVLAGRSAEQPTSEQDVDANAFGATVDLRLDAPGLDLSVAGRRVGAELVERQYAATGLPLAPTSIDPRQLTVALSAQRRWSAPSFDAGIGARTELWQSMLDGSNRHTFFNPRIWFTTDVPGDLTAKVAVQSGYRGPTINELYRPFRVGNVLTQANAQLKPEAVRGVELGVSRHQVRTWLRALAFWSRVDDAIVNVTLSTGGGTIIRERQNAARIHAKGIELELESRISPMLTVTASSAYTSSTFVRGPLSGLRVPQVPRMHHAVGSRGVIGRVRWSAEWRFIDEQFDDDRNLFPLEESSMFDARLGWMLNRKIEVFGAIENVLDEEQDVGRTPIRTIGLPRTSRVGVRFLFQ